jgi:predicted Zn-dependent protease
LDESRKCYLDCLDKHPSPDTRGWVYSGLGHLAARHEDWRAAADYWRKAAAILPDEEEIAYNLGDALLELGQYQDAIRTLNRNLRLGCANPAWTYFDLARCYQLLGDLDRARSYSDLVLRYAPDDQNALTLKKELSDANV